MPEVKNKLYRRPKDGMLAGVAAGFADYFDMDVTIMRLIFVAAALMTGGGAVIVYIVLAVVMPTPGAAQTGDTDVGQKLESLAEEVRDNGRALRLVNYAGFGLVALGLWFLWGQLYPDWFSLPWNLLWPVIIVLLGVLIITRSRRS